MKLGDLITLGVGMEDADFWIVRRGTHAQVGKPVREWGPEHIGVKVVKTDVLLPDYLFYKMLYVHGTGHWERIARGSTPLVSIRVDDIAKIEVT